MSFCNKLEARSQADNERLKEAVGGFSNRNVHKQEVLNNSLYIYELNMQGIYQGYQVMLHDRAWTVILTLSQDSTGTTHFNKAIELIEQSGNAVIKK